MFSRMPMLHTKQLIFPFSHRSFPSQKCHTDTCVGKCQRDLCVLRTKKKVKKKTKSGPSQLTSISTWQPLNSTLSPMPTDGNECVAVLSQDDNTNRGTIKPWPDTFHTGFPSAEPRPSRQSASARPTRRTLGGRKTPALLHWESPSVPTSSAKQKSGWLFADQMTKIFRPTFPKQTLTTVAHSTLSLFRVLFRKQTAQHERHNNVESFPPTAPVACPHLHSWPSCKQPNTINFLAQDTTFLKTHFQKQRDFSFLPNERYCVLKPNHNLPVLCPSMTPLLSFVPRRTKKFSPRSFSKVGQSNTFGRKNHARVRHVLTHPRVEQIKICIHGDAGAGGADVGWTAPFPFNGQHSKEKHHLSAGGWSKEQYRSTGKRFPSVVNTVWKVLKWQFVSASTFWRWFAPHNAGLSYFQRSRPQGGTICARKPAFFTVFLASVGSLGCSFQCQDCKFLNPKTSALHGACFAFQFFSPSLCLMVLSCMFPERHRTMLLFPVLPKNWAI